MRTNLPIRQFSKHCLVKHVLLLIGLISLVFISPPLFAATYYVAPNGNDSNPGSESQPWQTVQKAADTLMASDIVYIKAGTYNEQVIPKNSGSSNNYIVYSAYPGDVAIIDGSGISLPDEWGLFDMTEVSFIKVTGLKVINAGPHNNNAGILLERCNDIIIERNYTYNTLSSGIGVWNCENITIDGNEVELACNYGEQECITIAGTTNFEVRNNHVHHGGPEINGAEGICLKDGSNNGKVYGNEVNDLPATPGIYVDAWDKHTYAMEIYGNIVHDCGADGIILASEQGGLLENIDVYNNIVYKNKWVGILVSPNGDVPNSPMKELRIINNTVYDNGLNEGTDPWGGGIEIESSNLSDVIVRNNIVSQNLVFQIAVESYGQNFVVDYNLIHGYRGEISEETRGTDYVEGDPMFMSITEPDFHLQVNSPAINRGSPVSAPGVDFDNNPRPFGGGFDIGAFEFGYTAVEPGRKQAKIPVFKLSQNYPNPFNPSTTIEYTVAGGLQPVAVNLSIYDLRGRLVRRLVNEEQAPGDYRAHWNGLDESGREISSGIYFYTIMEGEYLSTRKMTVSR